jgi:hypothetical protein
MCFAANSSDNAAAKDLRNDLSGFAGAVDAIISQLIGRKTLGIKGAETGFVAEERAAGHGHAAGEENFDRRVEPNDRGAGCAEEFWAAGLCVGAAAESEDEGFFRFAGAAQRGAELIGFDLPESGLTQAFEHLRDFQAGSFFNAFIEIHETPGELAGKKIADGSLAGTHEAGKAEALRAA